MHCPADATECGPITDPEVRIEQLVDRAAGRVEPFEADDRMWRVTDREQAMFLLARGHKPTEIMAAIPRRCPEVWFFWLAAQGELPDYWAASRACTGFRRR